METTLFNLPSTAGEPTAEDTDADGEARMLDLRLHYTGLAHFFAAFEPRPSRPPRREPELAEATSRG